ncbi:hypothetical protein L842_5957 [Mycobacterium intracellulare MIN_052511_1280]|nr:hypothetical protein L842_5957 [Mycobacterium intracellulare MIN_052511_1280]
MDGVDEHHGVPRFQGPVAPLGHLADDPSVIRLMVSFATVAP